VKEKTQEVKDKAKDIS